MTTYASAPPPDPPETRRVTPANAQASWLAALLRDVAIIVAVVVYCIESL